MKKALIICLTPHYNIGGVETYNNHLINVLVKMNYQIDEYSIDFEPKLNPVREKNKAVNVINNSRKLKSEKRTVRDLVAQILQSYKDISKLVKNNNYDLIIDSRQGPFKWEKKWGKDFSKQDNCIWVQHLHPEFYNGKYLTPLNDPITLFVLKTWIKLCKRHMVYNYKNVVLYDSFNQEKFDQKKLKNMNVYCNPLSTKINNTKIDFSKKDIDFIYLGRVDKMQKNLGFLKKADPFLKKTINVYGKGEYQSELRKTKNVCVKGLINDTEKEEVFKRAKYIILVSKFEGFGFVVSEALTYGVIPIILDTYPSAKFLTKHGYLLDPKIKAKDYANFLNNLDYEKDKEKAIKCLDFAKNNLDIEDFEKKWEEIIKKHSL